jgi:hypothetical protein
MNGPYPLSGVGVKLLIFTARHDDACPIPQHVVGVQAAISHEVEKVFGDNRRLLP